MVISVTLTFPEDFEKNCGGDKLEVCIEAVKSEAALKGNVSKDRIIDVYVIPGIFTSLLVRN